MSYDELMSRWYGEWFLLMGVAGVLLESGLASFKSGKWVYQGNKYWHGLPFIPMYAVGGMLMYWSLKILINQPAVVAIVIATLVVSYWEYLGGVFCVRILKVRLWNYQKHWGNIDGHVSILSFSWWLILITLFYLLAFHRVLIWESSWRG